MTLSMADSIYPQDLPAGFDAYLGYVDGNWPTYPVLLQMFPHARVIGLTVYGTTLNADGADIEPGNFGCPSQPTAAQIAALVAAGAGWLKRKLATGPVLAPVAYCSVELMAAVVNELAAIGVPRSSVLLLSAHYWDPAGGTNYQPHICGPGPDSCQLIGYPQDGTQWADNAPGNGGAQIDSSLLADGFFGTPPTPQGEDMPVAIGATGVTEIYLLDGGKMSHIPDQSSLQALTAAGVKQVTVSAACLNQFLADYPPGQPAVSVNVPPITVPPLTIPPLTLAGTITPPAS